MKIIDANIHLPKEPNDIHEFDFNTFNVKESIKSLDVNLKKNSVIGGCVSILDTNFIQQQDAKIISSLNHRNFKSVLMIDPRKSDWKKTIEMAKKIGFIGIKFHSYSQQLDQGLYKKITKICQFASRLEMIISICCSYGTKDLYKFNGVRLISELLNHINTPILALHAGGKKVLDLMLIAEQSKNVFIDLSFSLFYYVGSTIEHDLVFSIKKIGSDRWLYGSDHPYIHMAKSKKNAINFLKKNSFNAKDIDKIMFQNGKKFFNLSL